MDASLVSPVRVAIVGTGHVGATFAYALLLSGLAAEIVLINRDAADAEGEAMDLAHATPLLRPARVWAGDYSDCASAAVVVVTAGAAQGEHDSRLDLAEQNGAIFRTIIPQIARNTTSSVLVIATNPVDVLTYATIKLSGLPPTRVIGSGTILDTSRLQALVGERLGVDPRSVHSDIIGEHGDNQVPVWSLATVGGAPVRVAAASLGIPFDGSTEKELARATREAARRVVDRKGATYYAVATGLLRIVEAILRDERALLTVSTVHDAGGPVGNVALSLPSIVGRDGVSAVIAPDLDPTEAAALARSADVLRDANGRLGLDVRRSPTE